MDSVMLNLPSEITEEILLRIPARSVLRFKTVCKQWRTLISDPRFVRNHVNRSLLDDGNLCHRIIGTTSRKLEKHSTISSMSTDNPTNLTEFKFQHKCCINPVRIYGSCNGLLLISNYCFESPLLWNPLLTEKRNYLPLCKLPLTSYRIELIGLGFAPSIDDYKVVALSNNIRNGYLSAKVDAGEIYSVKTGKWTTISTILPRGVLTINSSIDCGIHIQGSIYWVASYKSIITFDLTTEKFTLIKTPHCVPGGFELVEIQGCLGAFKKGLDKVVIWICKEGYWSKLVIIRHTDYIECLYSINHNEVLLMLVSDYSPGEKKCVIWDLKCMTFRNLPSASWMSWNVVDMVETLVSPIPDDDRSHV